MLRLTQKRRDARQPQGNVDIGRILSQGSLKRPLRTREISVPLQPQSFKKGQLRLCPLLASSRQLSRGLRNEFVGIGSCPLLSSSTSTPADDDRGGGDHRTCY